MPLGFASAVAQRLSGTKRGIAFRVAKLEVSVGTQPIQGAVARNLESGVRNILSVLEN